MIAIPMRRMGARVFAAIVLVTILALAASSAIPPSANAAYKIKLHEFAGKGLDDAHAECHRRQYVSFRGVPVQTHRCHTRYTKARCEVGWPLPTNVGLCAGYFVLEAVLKVYDDLACDGSLWYKKTASGVRRMQNSSWRCRAIHYTPPA